MKLTIIEGNKNVGKTYLIENSSCNYYKFPFTLYFDNFFNNNNFNEDNTNVSAYHFSNGYDITLLSLNAKGLANTDILYDRGFLSNIVLAIVGGRISEAEGYDYINFLHKNNLLLNIRIILIKSPTVKDERNKDKWESLNYNMIDVLYDKFIKYLKINTQIEIIEFFNNKTEQDLQNFKKII